MLTVDENEITTEPHRDRFKIILNQLGPERTAQVRAELDRLIDEIPPTEVRNRKMFFSSNLASSLTPWPHPLSHLYDVACEIEGDKAADEVIEKQAALYFGQFMWECIMNRKEKWMFYDPNLSPNDPNREITGKIYFEV